MVAVFAALLAAWLLCWATPAAAEVLQAPVGGRSIALGPGRVGCAAPGGGWTLDAKGTRARPPVAPEAVGQATELVVASDAAACANATTQLLTLIATERFPSIDPSSVTLFVDEARLELRGRSVARMGVAWQTSSASGSDQCRDAKGADAGRACSFNVGRNLPADPSAISLSWFPPGGRGGADVTTFGADGERQLPEDLSLMPARVVLSAVLPPDAAVDLSTGEGEISLLHPDAVSSVECTGASCRLAAGKLIVRGQSKLVNSVDVRLSLLPHVYFRKGDAIEAPASVRLSVLHCPMSVVSGAPFRNHDSARVVVKFEGRCAEDVSALHFFAGSTSLDVLETVKAAGASFVVLRLGSIDGAKLSITAARGDLDGIPVAVARTPMQPVPVVRSSLEISGYPKLNFIPNNRRARVHVAPLGVTGRLVLLPLDGIYAASSDGARQWVQGDAYAEGLTALRFGYRVQSLPPPLDQVDLGLISEPLQRPIREANIPAPIDGAGGGAPLIELVCADRGGVVRRLIPGHTAQIAYGFRDTCRLVIHRERLSAEHGTQKLSVEIDVLRADGTPRGEAHATQTLVLRAGREPRLSWIHGVAAPFDRIVVRVTHVADESHYLGASELLSGPASKWTAIVGTGHFRLYATSAIPTGLYRFGGSAEDSGVLSLNFGIISRLTWLDEEGSEGFLGLEAGVMGIGLAGDESTSGESLTHVGIVAGVGLSIPFANRSSPTQAAINLHAWIEHDIDGASSADGGSGWSIIFGPSISIGNIGANL